MNRRSFLSNSLYSGIGISLLSKWKSPKEQLFPYKDLVIGHHSHQYKIDMNWGALDATSYPVKDCHEMVQYANGRIILLTNETKNNIIIYDQSGNLVETWGTTYPGAHGLTIHNENGEEFLYISDNNRHEIIKTTLQGKEVMVLPFPKETGKYESAEQYIPTEVAVADNGDIYVADGYGLQYIVQYDASGNIKNVFGGKGNGDQYFDNAHGICIDKREADNPTLLITARARNQLKRFSLEGKLLEVYDLPGIYLCRPVIHGEHVYLATIWSGDGDADSGFISILNKDNQLISAPGGSEPIYKDGQLQRMHQTIKIFKHPHDVCVDEEENLYVAQWNAGRTYPIKLIRQ